MSEFPFIECETCCHYLEDTNACDAFYDPILWHNEHPDKDGKCRAYKGVKNEKTY